MRFNVFIISLFLIFFTSCVNKTQQVKEGIARENNVHLYQEQLSREIPRGLTKEDSLEFIEQYVINWAKEQILVQKAEEELPLKSKNVNIQLEKYRKSLLIYTFEQAYIENRLDTVISQDEIEEYYQKNLKDFVLKGYIIKGYYGSFNSENIETKNLDKWYKLKEKDDYVQLNSFSQINAIDYYLDTTNWIYFDKVLEKIPLEGSIHKSSFVKHKKKIKFEENGISYYLNIMDSKLEDEVSPLEFEIEKMKAIILNKRTQKIRRDLSTSLYEDALKAKQIIYYNKK